MYTKYLIALFFFINSLSLAADKNELNIARPDKHPYVKAEGNRQQNRNSHLKVNEARVYDFYQRQADYYMQQGKTSGTIPSYPGLDAGLHGHWGKYNQNSHEDGRWNDIVDDGIIGSHLIFPKKTAIETIEGGIVLNLNKDTNLNATFYPRGFNFIYFSQNAQVSYNSYRWGTSRGATVDGEGILKAASIKSNDNSKYLGYYKHQNLYVFSYILNGTKLLDCVESIDGMSIIKRTIQFEQACSSQDFILSSGAEMTQKGNAYTLNNGSRIIIKDTGLKLKLSTKDNTLTATASNAAIGDSLTYYIIPANTAIAELSTDQLRDLRSLKNGGPATLNFQAYQTSGTLAENSNAYVVDDIELPYKNKTNSLMFLTGIDFNQQGDAFICSLKGDLWKVTGINDDLKSIKWLKIASGLNQPFGLRLRNNTIYIQERTRIIAAHDFNNDAEIDFFESINNNFIERARSHSHRFGLEIDHVGNFYFASDTLIYKIDGKTRKIETIASGVRNCMGIGMMKDGSFIVGPQEGTNTPASSIFKIYKDDDYGFKTQNSKPDAPMAYVPRGIDNSTGGFLQMNDDRWGPLGHSFIGLSYGYGKWYQILPDSTGKRQQAATVPMGGQFLSGVVRAAKNPKDGQFYTVGLDGWGDYSTQDGCFHRIRYTKKTLYKPISYKTYFNGLRIDFPVKLNPKTVANIKNYFASQWDYLNSKQYGSPEYSVSDPDKLGHDILQISSVQLINDGKSIFVEIPRLQPVMQMHLRLHMKAADNTEFKTDLFPTIIELGEFYPFKNAQPKVTAKKQEFNLRTKVQKNNKLHTRSGKKDAHARKITIVTKNLQYDKKTIKVKAGETVAFILKNDDAMPHNLVITTPGSHAKVGMASFKMLNNPKAADMHYVPEMKEVLAYTYVIQPKGSHTLYFKVPDSKGVYPFFCSFPGHWQLMKGDLIVE